MIQKENIIPSQEAGGESNTEHSFVCDSAEQSRQLFEKVKHRLFNINKWHEYTGVMTAEFRLCDNAGNEVDRMVRLIQNSNGILLRGY